jgi:putative transposase
MKSLKIRLELNNKQTTMALRHSGTARHAYNWAVDVCAKSYENKEKIPTAIDLHKKLVAEVKKEHEWYYDSSKCAPQQSLRNVEAAYKNFHRKQKNSGYKALKYKIINGVKTYIGLEGLPRFKKKGVNDSFYLEGSIKTDKNKIKVPKFGWIKCSEQLPSCEIKNVVISRTANEWFIAFKVPFAPVVTEKTKGIVGVDLGIKTLATLSDGTIFESIKPYKTNKRKLKILQRIVSKRFVKGRKNQSNNYKKAVNRVTKLHQRIANIRKNYTHKLTTYLAKNHSEIVIEDLNVKGMSKNRKLASAILDGGFFEFRRQLEYKSKWYGSKLTIVNRFYPSSKTCSNCGVKKQTLKLSDRIFVCESCDFKLDRDLNASLNLMKMAESYSVSACGELKSSTIKVESSMKQELYSNVKNCVSYK